MSSRKELERAFKLIKRDQTDEALSILRPIVVEEPENVHAWWLLAYAETDPRTVREALVKVLTLDPNYANAPKAREMLEKLNQEYPPDANELADYPELAAYYHPGPGFVPTFEENLSPFGTEFDEFPMIETPDIYGEMPATFPEQDLLLPIEEPVPFDEDPSALEEEVAAEPEKKGKKRREKAPKEIKLNLEPEPVFDEEALAAQEERAANRQGRGRRLFISTVGLLIVALVVAAVIFGLTRGGTEEEIEDAGPLELITLDSQQIITAEGNTQAGLASASTNGQIVLAGSQLGKAFFIQMCANPSPDLPDLIETSMKVAAQQATTLQGQVDAVGVTIDDCAAPQYDNLYRAVVRIEDAMRYASGEIDWTTFQAAWKTA